MNTENFSKAQGHWILARMGKKVLRPGGKELTRELIRALNISSQDELVEFAPGLGYTAQLALSRDPRSYIGIDADKDAIDLLNHRIKGSNLKFQWGNASDTGMDSNTKSKVFGEAMLTMHADHRKSEIIKEAHRILKNGGLYAIHELGLTDVDEGQKNQIQKDLALAIKVNARPLTTTEWTSLLEQEGFTVREVFTSPMHLLEPKRIIDDEGLVKAAKIAFNILRHKEARKRILQMRAAFRKHRQCLNAIAIIAEKR